MTDIAHVRERILLGALMTDNAQIRQVQLSAEDFALKHHGQMFDVIRRLIAAGKVADPVTVADALIRERGHDGDWLMLAATMQQECLAPSTAGSYAGQIRESSVTRQASLIGAELQGGCELSEAIRKLIQLSTTDQNHACHVLDAMRGAIDELAKIGDGEIPGVRTGMTDLDASLGGMHDEDLIVIAARPAMGKTAFMLNLAASADRGVGIFSGEQGRAQLGMRLISIEGPVSLHRMRTAKLQPEEWTRLTAVMNAARDKPIWIYDKPAPTIAEIVSQARAWKFHNNIGVVMIDYLQKIRGGSGENFRLQVGDITTQLKDLARELKIPVIALAQVKREVEGRPMGPDGMGRMPYMSDIAEASIIEQEADQIITLYRPEVYDDQPAYKGLAYANACKNRHGPVGHIKLSWRGEYLKFGDLAKTEMQYEDRWSANA